MSAQGKHYSKVTGYPKPLDFVQSTDKDQVSAPTASELPKPSLSEPPVKTNPWKALPKVDVLNLREVKKDPSALGMIKVRSRAPTILDRVSGMNSQPDPSGEVFGDQVVHCHTCALIKALKVSSIVESSLDSKDVFLITDETRALRRYNRCSCSGSFVVQFENGRLVWRRFCHKLRGIKILIFRNNVKVWRRMAKFIPQRLLDLAYQDEDDMELRLLIASRAAVADADGKEKALVDAAKSDSKSGLVAKGAPLPRGALRRRRGGRRPKLNSADRIILKDISDAYVRPVGPETLDECEAREAIGLERVPPQTVGESYIHKVGDKSVHGEGVNHFQPRPGLGDDSNIWRRLTLDRPGMEYNPEPIQDGMALRVRLMLNSRNDLPTVQNVSVETPRVFRDRDMTVAEYKIEWSAPAVCDLLQSPTLESYRINGQYDADKVKKLWPVSLGLPSWIQYELSRRLSCYPDVYANTGLYLKVGLVYANLLERRLHENCYGRLRPNDPVWFSYRTIAATWDANQEAILTKDLEEGTFVWVDRELHNSELAALDLTANPIPRWEATAAGTPLRNNLNMQGIKMRVYTQTAMRPEYVADAISPESYINFWYRQAIKRGEVLDFVSGLTRAAMYATPQTKPLMSGDLPSPGSRSDRQRKVMIVPPTYELEVASVPKPKDFIWVWRVLGLPKGTPVLDGTMADARAISALTDYDFNIVSMWLSVLTSVAGGILLEAHQISGKQLMTVWGLIVPGNRYIRDIWSLFAINTGDDTPWMPWWLLMLGVMSDMFDVNIPTFAFKRTPFGGSKKELADPVANNSYFWGWFNWRIPYLYSPYLTYPVGGMWCDLWGVYTHNVTMNLSDDIMFQERSGWSGWYAFLGDKSYKEHAKDNLPWRYVTYAMFVLNNLMQDFRREVVWNVTYVDVPPDPITMLVHSPYGWQPEKEPNTFLIKPGTVRSFDRERDMVISPAILKDHFPTPEWHTIATKNTRDLYGAGIIKVSKLVDAPRGNAGSSIYSWWGLGGDGGPGKPGGKRQPNVEQGGTGLRTIDDPAIDPAPQGPADAAAAAPGAEPAQGQNFQVGDA